MARKPVKKTTRKATKKTTKKATKRTTKKTTRKRSPATQTKKRTQAKSKKKPTMNSTQKRLQERILNPWVRMETFEFENPVVYDIPWGDRFLSGIIQAKNIPGFGYVTDGVDERAQDYIAPDYSWMSFAMNKANKTVTTPNPKGKNPGNYQLRDDQKEDQETILRAREQGAPEFLIANGTGTGKTVTTWDTVKKINPKTALIVCPAAVIPVWRQHIRDMGDNGINIVVINYESLHKLVSPPPEAINARTPSTQNKHLAMKGKPYTYFDVVVFDEAHKLANPVSQRSRISAKIADNADFVLRLTATPGKDPSNLHHLWRGLSWVTGDPVEVADHDDFDKYKKWCQKRGVNGVIDAKFGNGIQFVGGDADIRKMHDIIYGDDNDRVLGIKRVPEEWGETVRQPLPITLTRADMRDYEIKVEDTMNSILKETSKKRPDLSRGIAMITSLRQKTGLLKAPDVVEYTKYAVRDLGEQVVIAAVYHRTVDTVSELLDRAGIKHAAITGRNTNEEKEEYRQAFQRGEFPVVITSVTTGISLHAGEESVDGASDTDRRMIIADIQWSPIEHRQLEGRINRNGRNGIITIPFLEGTMDYDVMNTLLTGLRHDSVLQDRGEENSLEFFASVLGIPLGDRNDSTS